MDPNELITAVVVGDDALENSFAGPVQQRPPSSTNLAGYREVYVVQSTTIELGEEGIVDVVTQWAAVDQDADDVGVVAVDVIGGRRCRRHEGRIVKWSPFTIGVEHVCRIVLELSAEVDGYLFVLKKRSSAWCRWLAERPRAFVLFISHRRDQERSLNCGEDVGALRIVPCLGDIMSAADSLHCTMVDGANVSVTASVFFSAAVGVAVVSRVIVLYFVLSLRNLALGYEYGRAFPAGVGPDSFSRDAANWLSS